MNTASVTDAVRPAALVERHQETKKKTQHARDVMVAVGYLTVTHFLVPLIAASIAVHSTWARRVMVALIPLAVVTALAYARRTPARRVRWELPPIAIQMPGGWLWHVVKTERSINWRRYNTTIIYLRVAVALVATLVAAAFGGLAWAGLAWTCWLYWFCRAFARKRPTQVPPWHSARIRRGMLETGLWNDKTLPGFRHVRPMETTDYADIVWLSLNGKSHEELSKKRSAFVAGNGSRSKLVQFHHDDTMDDDVMEIRFLNGHARAPKQHWALTAAQEIA